MVAVEELRHCNGCGEARLASDFRSSPYCRFCYRFMHGMRLAVPYETLLAEQNGKCAICGEPPKARRFHIDHVHASPGDTDVWVRGLLCARCNMLLGSLEGGWRAKAEVYLGREPRRFALPRRRINRRHRDHGPKSSWRKPAGGQAELQES